MDTEVIKMTYLLNSRSVARRDKYVQPSCGGPAGSNAYRNLLAQEYSDRGVKLTNHIF
jgi:hypothetical protein